MATTRTDGNLKGEAPQSGRSNAERSATRTDKRSVREPRSRLIARALEREILEQALPVGAFLGNEPELIAKFKIGRSALRQAIRQLESHGVAKMRRGPGGGLIVAAPARTAAVRALATYMELSDVSWSEIYEARRILEVHAASIATQRIDDNDITQLRELIAAIEDTDADSEYVIRTQLATVQTIAEMTRNPAMALFTEALNHVTTQMIAIYGDRVSTATSPDRLKEIRQLRIEQLKALVAGDAAIAQTAARRTIDVRLEIAEEAKALYDAHVSKTGTDLSVSGWAAPDRSKDEKLGILVALAMRRDISARALRPGTKLGQEEALRARYHVSREVFREALGILQLHSIIRAQRGRQAGFVVASADPTATVLSAARYLFHLNFPLDNLDELRQAIEVEAAPLVARRATEAQIHELKAVINRSYSDKEGRPFAQPREFVGLLSEMNGNRILGLFLRVISELGLLVFSSTQDSWSNEQLLDLQDLHGELAEAIAQREEDLARRRMLETARWINAQTAIKRVRQH